MDDVLRQAVQGISELITEPGMINVDFAHVRRIMMLGGGALMSIGQGQGENKAVRAIEQALHHPLLESVGLENAAGIIANFTGGSDITLFDVQNALNTLHTQTGPQTEVVMGVTTDEEMDDRAQVILIITGLGAPTLEEAMSNVNRSTEPRRLKLAEVAEPAVTEVKPADPSGTPPMLMLNSQNLDLPAFMRRKTR
jgi:cell division protein FtsZ